MEKHPCEPDGSHRHRHNIDLRTGRRRVAILPVGKQFILI